MQKKYIYTLILIGILFAFVLTIGVGYGLYVSISKDETKIATTLDCFKIYFSDTEYVNMTNIRPVLNEEGKESSPKTLTITNICKDTKELQLRLNILNTTTADISGLMVQAAGNIEQNEIFYKNLKNTKTRDENVVTSKRIGLIKIEPNETVRTNVKLWFNEKKAYNVKAEDILNAKFELIDTASSLKPTLAENIIETGAKEENPDFNTIATNEEGLYKTNDDEGESFYYRGSVSNNYVSFADNIWRIVRINGDGSIRMILENNIENSPYSEYSNAIDYTGLQYIYNREAIDNKINETLKNWYTENISNKNMDRYVISSNFCNDSSNTINYYHTYFSPYKRLVENKEAILTCPQTKEDFGSSVNQKIGLLTSDEVLLAGGNYNITNYNYYLYNGEPFYTQSPAEYYNYKAYIFYVTETGALSTIPPNNASGIRPVINLDSTTIVDGAGTKEDPYTLDLD